MLNSTVVAALITLAGGVLVVLLTNRNTNRAARAMQAEAAEKESARVEVARGEQGIERQRILDAATTKAQEVYEGLIAAIREQLVVQTASLATVQAELGAMRVEMTDKDQRIASLTRELADVKRQLAAKEQHAAVADARITELEATLRAHGIDIPATGGVNVADAEFFTDTSEFQTYLDDSYPHRIVSLRGDSGYHTDRKAAVNVARAKAMLAAGNLRVLIVYCVVIPGREQETFDRVTALIGAPFPRLVIMLDMESGPDFAGPGDHSGSANKLAALFAGWLGDWRRVWPYANSSDYDHAWPHRDPRLVHRVTASWGTHDPGTYAQQYYGATDSPVPAGYPTATLPFGRCDHNVIRRSITQIETDLGISAPAPPDILGEIMAFYSSKEDYEASITRLLTAQNSVPGDPVGVNAGHRDYTVAYAASTQAIKDLLLGYFRNTDGDPLPRTISTMVLKQLGKVRYNPKSGNKSKLDTVA